jgi:hypothetical protein
VTLSAGAPVGGAVVTLGSNGTSASVPASVTVAAGATTATFAVTTTVVTVTTTVTITASYGSATQTASLALTPVPPPPPAGISRDGAAYVSVNAAGASTSVSGVSSSPATAPRVLVALVTIQGINAAGPLQSRGTVTSPHLTWTRIQAAQMWEDTAEVWIANAPAGVASEVISATATVTDGGAIAGIALAVEVLQGATVTGATGAALASGSAAPQAAYTPARGSWVYAACNYYRTTAPTMAPAGSITTLQSAAWAANQWHFATRLTSASDGTRITIGASAPANPSGIALAILEVKSAAP